MEKLRILIIHKDDKARRGIHNILSRFDFDIAYADDGLQGLQTVRHKKPHLMICQVDLSVLNGIELGATIRKDPVLKDTPLILLHSQLDLDIINKAKLVDARAFLIKPYIDNSLIYAIKRALGERHLEINNAHSPVNYEYCTSRAQRYHYA